MTIETKHFSTLWRKHYRHDMIEILHNDAVFRITETSEYVSSHMNCTGCRNLKDVEIG